MMKKRILVVDDDPSLRALARAVFPEEYEVQEAVDGLDAWTIAQSWLPHLVITDLMMPRMHGYELCVLLKGAGGVKGVKVIVTSAKPFATDKIQSLAAGADAYVVKPFAVDDLLGKARKLLSQEEQAVPAAEPAAGEAVPCEAAAPVSRVPDGRVLPVYVHFWGTRGSCPVSGEKYLKYGGNTACTEVRIGEIPLIIDCGTGLREFGMALQRESGGKPVEGHIFVGHTHWDHIQGFPFFVPLYAPGNRFTVYSVHGAHGSLRDIFGDSMALDYFPVPLSSLGSKLSFVELKGQVDVGVAKVKFQHLNHPGVCIGFGIETGGRKITYLSDHETFGRVSVENEGSRKQDAEIAMFARDSDLLIMEAQYTEAEYVARRGWGHSTYDDVVRFAVDTGAKRLAVFHHDPEHTDDILDQNLEYCREIVRRAGSGMECFAARDGLRVDL